MHESRGSLRRGADGEGQPKRARGEKKAPKKGAQCGKKKGGHEEARTRKGPKTRRTPAQGANGSRSRRTKGNRVERR